MTKKKNVWCLSDTHGFHKNLIIPINTDMVIHSGDFSNSRTPSINYNEVLNFINWYKQLDIPYKFLCAGNHDTSLEAKMFTKEYFLDQGIIYLEHEYYELGGIKMFFSPYTKAFGQGWAYNVRPDRLHDYWSAIPEELDILVTHGPPKQILDVSLHPDGYLEYCGDEALRKAVLNRNIKFMQFGHIHDCKGVYNAGIRIISNCKTTFVNASCVMDGRFDLGITTNGQLIEI
jgi:Icc-related predicted phosphoesterase